ncbi:phage portal protein [Streptomyces sp. NPDC002855]|uniref:phage portal protein n=1 Tax=Streptomyces sp. NPDC002855 TaxID=3154437 RepID=UPI003321A52F
MGLFRKLGFAASVASNPDLKGFTQPPFWSPEHPMNQAGFFGSLLDDRERIENSFESYVEGAFKKSGTVFSCISTRAAVLSEARFLYRGYEESGRPSELEGGEGLELLEHPWPGGTTGELVARMEQDASLAGNFFGTTCDDLGRYGKASRGGPGRRIVRMRPDWVTILVGSLRRNGHPLDLSARIIGYLYEPRQASSVQGGVMPESVLLMPDEVCHYSPEPDPIARFRGMSWLTPVIREISADIAAAKHKEKFYENAAVPNMAIKFDKETSEDAFNTFVEKFNSSHKGAWNAYKTLFLMGGADVTPLTMDFKALDFAQVIGKGENRIAQAAGVPSAWVGNSEGMQGSSLNAGNLGMLRRRFADGTIRPLWRKMSASLEVLVEPPAGKHLWFDERGVAFLREDARDLAEIMQTNFNALEAGIRAGYEPDVLVEATRDNDVGKLLGKHTDLRSVQLLPPVSPEDIERQNDAAISEIQARSIAALAAPGIYTAESIAEAVTTNDMSKLVKATEVVAPQPPEPKPAPGTTTDSGKGGGNSGQENAR